MRSCYVSKLHMAVSCRNESWVKRLLAEGANPNVETNGWTLLQQALFIRNAPIAKMLKAAGATGQIAIDVSLSEEIVVEHRLVDDEVTRRTYPRNQQSTNFVGSLG